MTIKHFIATDGGYERIYGVGSSAEAALADAVAESDFRTAHPDDADPEDVFQIFPATETLFKMVNDFGGDISWSVKNGIACTDDEAF